MTSANVADSAPAARLEPAVLRSWAALAQATLGTRRGDLDALNVFPVADSDTGTNLYLTMSEAASAVEAVDADAPSAAVAAAFARGALVGARGNSGVIVGQYLGAFVRSLTASPELSGRAVSDALRAAAAAAYDAVADPVEGTVLTVARVVGDHARSGASGRADVAPPGAPATEGTPATPAPAVQVLDAAIEEGYVALQATTAQLAALRDACVLDAGAWGLLLVLDALADALGSRTAAGRAQADLSADPPTGDAAGVGASDRTGPVGKAAEQAARCHGGGEFEVMYLVAADGPADGPADHARGLRARLSEVGESVAVVGAGGLWHVHVHTDTPLEALSVVDDTPALRVHEIRVRHLGPRSQAHARDGHPVGLVTVTRAPRLVGELARAGAVVVLLPSGSVPGGELRRAVQDAAVAVVVVLAVTPVLGLATPHHVVVLDDLSEAQVVSGAATLATLRTSEVSSALSEVQRAVAAVRTVVVDPPDADVSDGRHADLVTSAATTLLATGGALLTLVSASGTGAGVLDRASVAVRREHQDVDVVVLAGGGPGSSVVLGVE